MSLQRSHLASEYLNFDAQMAEVMRIQEDGLDDEDSIIFFLTKDINTDNIYDNRSFTPFSYSSKEEIKEILFLHEITGREGTTSYNDLKTIISKGFTARDTGIYAESDANMFLNNIEHLTELNYQLCWEFGRNDNITGDKYAFLTNMAAPKYEEFQAFKSDGPYSIADRVAVSEVKPENINSLIISINSKNNPIERQKYYDEELKSMKKDLNIVYLLENTLIQN